MDNTLAYHTGDPGSIPGRAARSEKFESFRGKGVCDNCCNNGLLEATAAPVQSRPYFQWFKLYKEKHRV